MKVFVKKKHFGVAALEASLTLPVIVILIFFILEMMKVNNTRTAMDSMALEATLDFISNANTSNFATIIAKHKPRHLATSDIKYYFTIYNSLDEMCSKAPYGNEEVYWPASNTYQSSTTTYIDSNRDKSFYARQTSGTGYITLSDTSKPENTISNFSGKVFVLTFVCDYKFSSAFVKKLFAGGSNVVDGTRFLIWGRGVGICD